MRRIQRCLLLFLTLACSPVLLFSQNEWVFKNEKEGVKVYYRKTSDIQEVKLISSIKVPLSGLIQLFSEVELYPTWGYKVMESRLIKKVSDTEMYYYSRLDFPWPLSDRDLVMHTKLEQDPVTRKIIATSKAVPNMAPEVADVVRITNATTQWTLIPGAGGWLYTEYYIYSSPGGNIPDWMINMAVDVGPRETIKNIRNIVQQYKYQSARLAHIRD
jgi:hypothetical protein